MNPELAQEALAGIAACAYRDPATTFRAFQDFGLDLSMLDFDPVRFPVITEIFGFWLSGKDCDEFSLRAKDVPVEGIRAVMSGSANLKQLPAYADVIKKFADARRYDIAAYKIREILDEYQDDARKAARDIVELASNICIEHESDLNIDQLLDKVIERNQRQDDRPMALPMGKEMEEILARPLVDEFMWLMAPPSVGKTALALQWASELAKHGRVDYVALEGMPHAIMERIVARETRVEGSRPYTNLNPLNTWTKEQCERVSKLRAEKHIRNIHITRRPNTLEKIAMYSKLAASQGSQMIIIDNLKNIRPSQNYENRMTMFLDYSLKLRHIRDDIAIPVMVVHHVNPDGTTRWSRDVDADSDLTILLMPDGDPLDDNKDAFGPFDPVKLKVTKNRDGRTGALNARFYKNQQFFACG